MHKFANKKWLPVLMIMTIMAIAAFQVYWLAKAYEREQRTLEMRTNYLFRETVFNLQGSKLKLDRLEGDSSLVPRMLLRRDTKIKVNHNRAERKMTNMMDVIMKRVTDSDRRQIYMTSDTLKKNFPGRRNRLMQFLFEVDSLQDSVRVVEIQEAYRNKLDENQVAVPFSIRKFKGQANEEGGFSQVTLGFTEPVTFKLELGNTIPFLLKRISVPILFSIFLVALTFFSFMLLYRNMIRQRRLGDIKNEFISNITHELKTPIATVSVAIEALRSFNATMDPSRTKEYLDISANELQRLSLLVDKVLKLSMFEKKEIELIYESLDMKLLVEEVTSSLRLQFEKRGAAVNVESKGNTTLEGDRLHLVSVIFNLLDNALKYSPDTPLINILVEGNDDEIQLIVSDRGLGIPPEYHGRIFEKFFRVPNGNLHNTKGYGLGLSYVAHVVKKHKGSIRVESEENNGSRFRISLPGKSST
ncbi:MAG: HAMP domain-containing histidine kinase [Flavisolibacter sp.]|jgi:two-component system phosphate regulon sensor histidine kinase PhoR|nr:HAMP domain-containing histidine kinase [Flavisolibacter sp.]